MKKITILLFSIALIWIMCSPICLFAHASEITAQSEIEARAYANENDTWVICYQQGARTSNFYQYDATDTCLYFSYSKHGCVDVYDTQGVFLYSIIFPERQNGCVSVRCENDQVYICTKDNILYVFAGTEEVVHMDYDAATEKGYDFFWFDENNPHISVDGKWICWLDETGNVIKQIPTPTVIKETLPPSDAAMSAVPIIGASLFLAVIITKMLTQVITSKHRKTGTP